MAALSIYLFWAGLLTSVIAVAVYAAYTFGATLPDPRLAAQTTLGEIVIPAAGRPNRDGIGRLATLFTSLTVLALGGFFVTRWVARRACSNVQPVRVHGELRFRGSRGLPRV